MPQTEAQLIAVGGFPGSGKSSVSGIVATELGYPVLASDLFGNTIKDVLVQHGSDSGLSSLAFRAGYATLFAVAEEIVGHRCSVIIDCSLGWQFQWDALDAIGRRTGVRPQPVILECSPATCIRRLEQRHRRDPVRYPSATEFFDQPQLRDVRRVLETIERPDVRRIDAERPIAEVCADLRRAIGRPQHLDASSTAARWET
ncbi:AAA family ATPase [Microlunatus soli]|uniref:Predicted kinase n=1 Tax=Microlunatus soli TaxID=630515 RepID=A0A1H1WKN4_9ACTN|nr:AAA family ATPase [Microlunatus soli]SDS96749.1 Predicted kinase [Microlunatus soli]